VLDAEAEELKGSNARLSDRIVERLREKVIEARVRSHDQFINRYERRNRNAPSAAEILSHVSGQRHLK
jgi:hypothetical protein